MSHAPDQKPKGIIEWFIDGLNVVADAITYRVKFALLPKEEKQRIEQDRQAQEIHLHREFNELQEVVDSLDEDVGEYAEHHRLLRREQFTILYLVRPSDFSKERKELIGITPEYVSQIKQDLAQNILKTGKMFPLEYAKSLDLSPDLLDYYTKEITKNIAKEYRGKSVPDDLQERLGIEIPQRDSSDRDKSK